MVKSTLIARVADGLPLAASMDDEDSHGLTEYTNQAKHLMKRLSKESEQKCSIDSHPFVFHYMIEFGVCYLCVCEKSYPKKLAFGFLEELQTEFHALYGHEMQRVARPYAFVKFDNFIQKTKKNYKDARTQRNLQKLNEDLGDVTRIMTKNIQEVLGRGEQLERMSNASQNLSSESKKYLKDSRHLNWQALYQKYGPPIIVLTIVILVFYIRVWWW
ncbi:Longin-like domain-containing protein [Globomyces pollinis-pini]|nr:Longin-like domain-containing protein [Globomyces pollinis-pini]